MTPAAPLSPRPFVEVRIPLHAISPTAPTRTTPPVTASSPQDYDGTAPVPSASVIRLLERLGRVRDVRRPTPDRVAVRRS